MKTQTTCYGWVPAWVWPEALRSILALLAALSATTANAAFAWRDDFDSAFHWDLRPTVDPGTSALPEGGQAVLRKAAGIGNARVSLEPCHKLIGDFTVTAKAERSDLGVLGEAGLFVFFGSLGFADIYFIGGSGIEANDRVLPDSVTVTNFNPSSIVEFRIRREGQTLYWEYDDDTGFRTILSQSHPNLAGPVSVALFLLENHDGTEAHTAKFDYLQIDSDARAGSDLTLTGLVPRTFGLTTFATDFPNLGPATTGASGIGFRSDGKILATDDKLSLTYVFPDDADGQSALSVPVNASNQPPGPDQSGRATCVAQLPGAGGQRFFMTKDAEVEGNLNEISADGTVLRKVADIGGALGVVAFPPAVNRPGFSGHLFVSGSGKIFKVHPDSGATQIMAENSSVSGMVFSPNGTRLYCAWRTYPPDDYGQARVVCYDTTGAAPWPLAAVGGDSGLFGNGNADGLVLGLSECDSGVGSGFLYANCNDGTVWELDLPLQPNPLTRRPIASCGSRGAFAYADPFNNTMLMTQTDRIERLIPPAGLRFFGAPTSGGVIAPSLTINVIGPNIVISWPFTGDGFTLQRTTAIGGGQPASWTPVNLPQVRNGYRVSVTMPLVPAGNRFFRLAFTVPNPCVPPPPGLIGWWPGEDNANDVVGGNPGVVNGTGFAPGEVCEAFNFDGLDDYVNVPGAPDFGTDDFTVEFWVRFNSLAREYVIIEKWVQVSGGSGLGWTFVKLANDYFRFAQTPDSNIDFGPVTEVNAWMHLAATRSGDLVRTYRNGFLTGSLTGLANLNSASSLKFGHRGDPNDTPGSTDTRGFYLNGSLDEVSLYNRALTVSEVQAIYNAGRAGKCRP